MNDTFRWIMIILLLLLIGAAVFMLLRSPGKADGEGLRGGDRDRDGVADADEARGMDAGRQERGVYDQHADHDVAGTPAAVDRPGDAARVDDTRLGAAPEEVRTDEPVTEDTTAYEPVTEDTRAYEPVAEDTTYEPAPEETPYEPAAGADDTVYVDESSRPVSTDAQGDVLREDVPVEEDVYPADTSDTVTDDRDTYVGDEHRTAAPEPGDGPPFRDAAAIGAAAAAGTAAVSASSAATTDHDLEAPGHHDQQRIPEDEAGYAADTTAYRDESAAYTGETGAEVHPLSDEDVEAGARTEPLTADEVVAASGDDSLDDGRRSDGARDDDGFGGRTDEGRLDETLGDQEYAVGEDRTYRADDGEAYPVEGTGVDAPTGARAAAGTTAAGATAGGTYTQDPLMPGTADDATAAGLRDGRAVDAGEDMSDGTADDQSYGTVAAERTSHSTDVDDRPVDEGWDAAPPTGGTEGGTMFAESVYGAGSAQPLEDGSGPAGWEVKGNSGSMLFHTPDSPSYDAVRAEVWFESEEAARQAGFAHWDRRRR